MLASRFIVASFRLTKTQFRRRTADHRNRPRHARCRRRSSASSRWTGAPRPVSRESDGKLGLVPEGDGGGVVTRPSKRVSRGCQVPTNCWRSFTRRSIMMQAEANLPAAAAVHAFSGR